MSFLPLKREARKSAKALEKFALKNKKPADQVCSGERAAKSDQK
jgi:hypothetical protein